MSIEDGPLKKKQRTDAPVSAEDDGYASAFGPETLKEETQNELRDAYAESSPYKHCKISNLISDDLLSAVKREIEENLVFTSKETDIYKVNQTGDLANLSGLPDDEKAKLANLGRLRDAMYSPLFREYIQKITQCGPLSGTKTDMSINTYTHGSHLLNHDDVIGTRRVSYILYLVEKGWKPEWGGALRLYPTLKPGFPAADPTLVIPPEWNQLCMFTVQPGRSFHDVEEVFVEGKPRMSISGWFHVPQEGEPGYGENQEEEDKLKSTLEQLQGEGDELDLPRFELKAVSEEEKIDDEESEKCELTDAERKYLGKYMNPVLLKAESMKQLRGVFEEECKLSIQSFLNKEYAEDLKAKLEEADKSVPQHSDDVDSAWKVAVPPHKHRYLFTDDASTPMGELSTELYGSQEFRKWLAMCTSYSPISESVLARRFRPGHDYTLATPHVHANPTLCSTLCLSPSEKFEEGEVGGYEIYMATGDEADDDPAIYKAAAENEDDDGGILVEEVAGWNKFLVVLRDEGTLRFIKYVSKAAGGSRWEVSGEWGVEVDEEED
ncbi:putative component of NuA3 histone acetyltransferase complex [Saitoella coloradoensis]